MKLKFVTNLPISVLAMSVDCTYLAEGDLCGLLHGPADNNSLSDH